MVEDAAAGTHVVAIWHKTLEWAVEELLERDARQLEHVKVRSGEHLAAILVTSFLGVAPYSVDTAGGVDLLFKPRSDRYITSYMPAREIAAFEVKSMPGIFRQTDNEIDRRIQLGKDTTGMGVSVQVKSAATIIDEARPTLKKIADSLLRKTGSDASRNGFLVVHPFDHLAAELATPSLISPHLPDLLDIDDLDTVWVLWVPDHLTMWSRKREEWVELIFSACNPDEANNDTTGTSSLQRAGAAFAEAVGYAGGDPYFFGLRSHSDGP